MTDIVFSTATALAKAIRQKQVTASDVLEAHLAHIAKHNPRLNAVVTLYEVEARKRARQADDAMARGEVWGPLHGVPVTLKNLHSVAGMLSPWAGHPDYAHRIPLEDSAMPAKLRRAGAVIVGLTNAHLLDNNIFGRTNNPWDVERSPNGSSAGSVAPTRQPAQARTQTPWREWETFKQSAGEDLTHKAVRIYSVAERGGGWFLRCLGGR